MKNLKTKIILTAILTIVLGLLIKADIDNKNIALKQIDERFAGELAKCEEEAKEGETCSIEYTYVDGHQTPVSANIIKR